MALLLALSLLFGDGFPVWGAGMFRPNGVVGNEQQTTPFSAAQRQDKRPLLFLPVRLLLTDSLSAAQSASPAGCLLFINQYLDTYGHIHIIPNQCRKLASNKRISFHPRFLHPLPPSTLRLTRHPDRMY